MYSPRRLIRMFLSAVKIEKITKMATILNPKKKSKNVVNINRKPTKAEFISAGGHCVISFKELFSGFLENLSS